MATTPATSIVRPAPDQRARPAVRLGGRPFRPPVGMPAGREDRRAGALLSLLVHGAVLALLLGPAAWASQEAIRRLELGAGGPGPAGGGGGGTRGTGGWSGAPAERLTWVTPPSAAPAQQAEAPVVKPPEPVVLPPPVEKPVPTVTPAPVVPPVAAPRVADGTVASPTTGATVATGAGTGGGTGADGTGGNGPGSGGGVGSGIGTGRGSGVGPGTGGGTQANYPPTPTEMFLPPFPVPDRVKGFHLIAEFDVDESGRVVAMRFTETGDGDYNRKLRDILRAIRFRPGTRPDGTPIRMKTQIEYSF